MLEFLFSLKCAVLQGLFLGLGAMPEIDFLVALLIVMLKGHL